MAKKTISSSRAPAAEQPGEIDRDTCVWRSECLRVAAGSTVVESASLHHRRDRICFEGSGVNVQLAATSSVQFGPGNAPQRFPGGSSPYRWSWACCRGRCLRAWIQTGLAAQSCCFSARRFLMRFHGEPDGLERSCRRQAVPLGRLGRCCSILCIALLLFGVICGVAYALHRPHVPSWNATLSVLVQHEDAPQRMRLSHAHKVKWVHLPSWTLRVVPALCEDCLDNETYGVAMQRAIDGLLQMQLEAMQTVEGLKVHQRMQRGDTYNPCDAPVDLKALNTTPTLPPETSPEEFLKNISNRYAVFANIGAPLGKVGPMLLAMSSLTDDIDVAVELPHWHWLRYTRIFSEIRAVEPPPYIAVMGIPSVDSIHHKHLRDAQRNTWQRYTDVADSTNSFRGRLLPLYVFAAPERNVTVDPTWVGQDEDTGIDAAAEMYRPTMKEFADASEFYRSLAQSSARGVAAPRKFSYRQRRMLLRSEWRRSDLESSPCAHAISSTVRIGAGNPRPPLAVLADHLQLPVTPAFTAVARFLCEASASLWLETLQHRDALWIDMLADRKAAPTLGSGDRMSRLATAVGTTQKTVLWLEYAYHAFPYVPFILKGDVGTYIKVPQLMSDLVYMLSGQRHRNLTATWVGRTDRAPTDTEAVGRTATTIHTGVSRSYSSLWPTQSPEKECLYWGLVGKKAMRAPYFTGMLYLMTRKVARVVLEAPQEAHGTQRLRDVVLIAMFDFNPAFAAIYTDLAMSEEDRFIGSVLRDRRMRVAQLCPNPGITYVEESTSRFHPLRRNDEGAVTWASTAIHGCTPASMRYLHRFYFPEEHRLRAATPTTTVENEYALAARDREAQWIRNNANASLGPGWEDLPSAPWIQHIRSFRYAQSHLMSLQDGVAVYNITVSARRHDTMMLRGLMIVPNV